MYCRKCGAKVDEQSKFCQACGTPTLNSTVPTTQEAPISSLAKDTAIPESRIKMNESDNQQTDWYYLEGSNKKGPFNYAQMADLIRSGSVQRSTLVWTAGLSDWIAAGQGSLSKEFENIVPFAPLSEISDKWIWALAVLPLAIISPAAEYITRLNGLDSWIPIACTVVANIFFLYKDSDELKKAGQDAEKWLFLGLILVPVYLYIRESKTNKKYAPVGIWCLLFVFSLFI